MTGLRISSTLELPLEFVTQPAAILAMRGAGKSNAAAAMFEEMYDHNLPCVVIDPKGDYWGIRSSIDGTGPGLPIPVFGGLHGDVPLEPGAGAFLADTIVDLNLTCVLDVSEFASKAQQIMFLTDFANRLFRLHGKTPQARHLFLEEADEYLPQRVPANMAPCVGAWTRIVKQGRSRGLGITIVSQRSAVVNKDALTQIETLIAMRVTSPQDRKAIHGWVEYQSAGQELVDSLPTLKDGEAWIISPHWLNKTEQLRFRQRRTFDSGATPLHGKVRVPGTIADIDVMKLRTLMADTIERAEARDPKLLQAKLRQVQRERDALEQMLKAEEGKGVPVEIEVPVEVKVPVPFVPPEIVDIFPRFDHWFSALRQVVDAMEERVKKAEAALDLPEPKIQLGGALLNIPRPTARQTAVRQHKEQDASRALTEAKARQIERDPNSKLSDSERAVLIVLSRYPDGLTQRRLAVLAGQKPKKSTIRNIVSRLRMAGLLEGSGTDVIRITAAGEAEIAGAVDELPEGRELIEWWISALPEGDGSVLRAIIKAHPRELDSEELCALTGYDPALSTIRNVLSRLRTKGLIGRGRALDFDFAQAIT